MAQRKMYRILTLAVMAVVLTALLAVSAFADGYEGITGGFGKINGLDPNAEYQARPVIISTDGTTLVSDGTLPTFVFGGTGATTKAWKFSENVDATLTFPADNHDLAGLYVVSSDNWATQSDIIYVYGKQADRAEMYEFEANAATGQIADSSLYVTAGTIKVAKGDVFYPGIFTVPKASSHLYKYYTTNLAIQGYATDDYQFSAANAKNLTALKTAYNNAVAALEAASPEDANYAELQAAVETADTNWNTKATYGYNAAKTTLGKFNFKYTLAQEEIIPVSEINQIPFKVYNYSASTACSIANNITKFVAYVLVDGEIQQFTWSSSPYTYVGTQNGHTGAGNNQCLKVDFTIDDGWDTETGRPTEGYLLAFVVKPFADFPREGFTASTYVRPSYGFFIQHNNNTGNGYVYSIDELTYETPDVTVDGTVISGLDSGITYKVATYDGAAVGEEVATITGVTSYTLGEGSFALWIPEDEYANASGYTYFEIVKPAYPAPTGLEVQGTTVIGLDDEKTYTVAPYGIDTTGAAAVTGEAQTIPAGESHDLADYFATPVGLYAIFVPEDATHGASDPAVVYVYGDYADRAELGEWEYDGSTPTKFNYSLKYSFTPGYVTHNSHTSDDTKINYKGYKTSFPNGYYFAVTDSTTGKCTTSYSDLETFLLARKVNYTLTSEEIIPVYELNHFKFGLNNSIQSGYAINDIDLEFIALVMNDAGEIEEYTWSKHYDYSYSSNTYKAPFTVNFDEADGWDANGNPTEGYLVAFVIKPFNNLYDGCATKPGEAYTRLNFNFYTPLEGGYSIDEPVLPTYATPNVTTSGTVINGLDDELIYEVATYDGATVGEVVATISSATSYDLGEWGSYAIRVAADAYHNASEYFYFEMIKPTYDAPTGLEVQGTKIIGLDDDKTYTVVPYGIDNTGAPAAIGTAITIPAGESHYLAAYTDSPAGLYAINVAEDAYGKASESVIIYVYGDYSKRADLGERSTSYGIVNQGQANEKDYSDIYKFRVTARAVTANDIYNRGYFTRIRTSAGSTIHSYQPLGSSYHHNINSEKETTSTDYATASAAMANISWTYTFTANEIVPVSEVNSYSFMHSNKVDGVKVTNNKVKFVALVMNDEGEIETYNYYITHNFSYTANGYINPNLTVDFTAEEGWDTNTGGRPKDGYLVAFHVYPFTELSEDKVTLNSTGLQYHFSIYEYSSDRYSIDEPELPVVETTAEITGVQFQLDGTINIKLPYTCEDSTVVDLALTSKNALSGTSYKAEKVDGAFIIKVLPKDAHTLVLDYKLIEDGTVAETGTTGVPAIVDSYLENQEYASVHNLVEALAEYCEYAYYYFNGEEDAVEEVELKDTEFVASAAPTKTGTLDGITPHSISLILEETVTLRHYFVVSKDLDLATVTVTATIGGENVTASLVEATNVAEGAENRYAYVDIENIPAHNLGAETVVTVNGTITINCSAVGYVYKAQNDSDSELANLAKAIANYAYEAKNYKAN